MNYTLEVQLPEAVTFYGDPICPWTLKSYKLLRRACDDLNINLKYRPLSLKIINEKNEISDQMANKLDESFSLLLIGQRLIEKGFEDHAVKFYEIAADLLVNQKRIPNPTEVIQILEELGMDNPTEVVNQSDNSESTEHAIRDTHNKLKPLVGDDYGSPVVILEPEKSGFFGPIVTDPDSGDAKETLLSFILLSRSPSFSEIKRKR